MIFIYLGNFYIRFTRRTDPNCFLCRSLWLFTSFTLQAQDNTKQGKGKTHDENRKVSRMNMLLLLLNEINTRSGNYSDESWVSLECTDIQRYNDIERFCDLTLFESLCLVVLSRIVQNREMRPLIKHFLFGLTDLPIVCMYLLELLLLTGTRPVVQKFSGPQKQRSGSSTMKDKGTKFVALDTFGMLLNNERFTDTPHTFRACILPVLWECVLNDFSMRNAAVNIISE
jgi:hypothetical protein